MSTSKGNVGDDDATPDFDFRRATPSPFRDQARRGMRFHIVTDGAGLPTVHVTARRREGAWWVEIDDTGLGRLAQWSTIEATARHLIAESDTRMSRVPLTCDYP